MSEEDFNFPEEPDEGAPPMRPLPPGVVVPSQRFDTGRSVVLEEQPDRDRAKLIDSRIRRDWEYATVARPVDYNETVYEVPTTRTVRTFIPKIQVREVVKTIPSLDTQWEEEKVEVPHKKIIDKYVEVPMVSGTEVKYVPKVEVRERIIETSKPEVKWVEKLIEVPQVKEVVRYIESNSNIETVIRYVAKGSLEKPVERRAEEAPPMEETRRALLTPRLTVPISPASPRSMPPSPRLDRVEQLFIPHVAKTVEVEKEVPVTVDVPVPFMVPKPIQVPVEVPVIRFRDHFVPVPVRRHVIPQIKFTDETYEVECTKERPTLVIEDYYKPAPVNIRIRLKEKDIKIIPVDPSDLSQADFHAMWMRVNADLLDVIREQGGNPEVELAFRKTEPEEEDMMTTEEGETDEQKRERAERRQKRREDRKDSFEDSIRDPDFGPLPLHPGHPLMMTFLQNQWIQNPSTITHNMYTPEFFRYHASALDSLMHPQPHQVNITQDQSIVLGPLPAEAIPSPWEDLYTHRIPPPIQRDTLS